MLMTVPRCPIDLDDPAFLGGDRTAAYTAMTTEAPVARVDMGGQEVFLAFRHADVAAISRLVDARVRPLGELAPAWMGSGPTSERLKANLAQTDAPIHTRLRQVVGPMFIPRRIEKLREVSALSVVRTLDTLGGNRFDAVADLAVGVPRGVICHLLGVPEEDWAMLAEKQNTFLMIFSPAPLPEHLMAALDEVTAFYLDYFDSILKRTPEAEYSDYIRTLVDGERRGDLTHTEVLSLMHTVFDAGFETTRTSISNTIELLATVPGLFETLSSAAPAEIDNAIEEILRVRTPIHARDRILTEDYTAVDGSVIPAGARVFNMLAASNLDVEVYPNPTDVDPFRPNAKVHNAFGGGLHHCLGAPIARIQLQETLKGLVQRFSAFDIVGESSRHPSLVFPALATLPVAARAR